MIIGELFSLTEGCAMITTPRQAYDSDLNDAEWKRIRPLIPRHPPNGRLPKISKREIVNAIFYVNKTGCQWRSLPHDFPCWSRRPRLPVATFRNCQALCSLDLIRQARWRARSLATVVAGQPRRCGVSMSRPCSRQRSCGVIPRALWCRSIHKHTKRSSIRTTRFEPVGTAG